MSVQPFGYVPEPEPDPDKDNPASPDYEPTHRRMAIVEKVTTIRETILIELYSDDKSVSAEEIAANNKGVVLGTKAKSFYEHRSSFEVDKHVEMLTCLMIPIQEGV